MEECLLSQINTLDAFLGGGLPRGNLVEWGLPPERGGREMVLYFLAQALAESSKDLALWVLGKGFMDQVKIYPTCLECAADQFS